MADLIIKPSSSNDSLKFQGSDNSAQFTIAGATGSLGSGIAFPAGHVIQTKDYTFDNSVIFTGISSDAWKWVTATLKGGTSDYITFDNPITANNRVHLSYTSVFSTAVTDVKYCNWHIFQGTSTTHGYAIGTKVSGYNTTNGNGQGIYCWSQWDSNAAARGRPHSIAFQHSWVESNTNPKYSIAINALSYDGSNTFNAQIGVTGYSNNSRTDVSGYQIRIQEIQV